MTDCPTCPSVLPRDDDRSPRDVSRRGFLHRSVATAAAAGLTASAATLTGPRQALAQTTLTPDAALQALMDGNRRYVDGRMTALQHDLDILHDRTAEKQEPFAAVLSCADSRVPVELVFDQTIGHLFVCRVAGNIASTDIIASLEYGAAVLGTKAILVLGHQNCGAVQATIAGKAVPGQISALYASIRPAVDEAGLHLDPAIKANARRHAALLREASPVLAGLIKKEQLKVVAGYYELRSGKVSLLD